MFEGFLPQTLDFFRDLRFHNNREWFQEHRGQYEQWVKAPVTQLCAALAPVVLSVDPQLDTRPARCISRPRRDTRFSKDKSPYRDHVWIGYRRGGQALSEGCAYFFEIFEDYYHYGFGQYGPDKPRMERLRGMMLADLNGFERIAGDGAEVFKHFDLIGEEYQRLLPSSKADRPLTPAAARFYDRKYICLIRKRPIGPEVFSPELAEILKESFLAGARLYRFLRAADE